MQRSHNCKIFFIGVKHVKELGPGGHVLPGRSSLRAVFTCISVRYQVQNIFLNCSWAHKKKKKKTNSLFNHLNSSRAWWLSWKLCDFGSRGTQFDFHRGQLFISVSIFFLKVRTAKNSKVCHINGDGLRTCAPVKSIKTSQQYPRMRVLLSCLYPRRRVLLSC